MIKGPKITIITACYNAEKNIEQTIQSVINQTYDNIEYIIVDGASSDDTMNIVRKYEEQINIIISESDQGVYDAFNKGAKLATGDYIQYLNADDYLLNNTVLIQIANFIVEKQYPVIVYGGITIQDELTGYNFNINKHFSFDDIKNGQMIPHPAAFVKRDKMLEMNLFNCKYRIAADFNLVANLYTKYSNQIYYVPLLVAVFRLGGLSSNFSNRQLVEDEVRIIVETHFAEVKYIKKETENELYFKKWLELKLFSNKTMGDFLKNKGIRSVVIFGSGQVSNMLVKEFLSSSIDVKYFVDNDVNKQNTIMNGISIIAPSNLIENNDFDAIIFGFEGYHEKEVIQQLSQYNCLNSKLLLSWRDIISKL